MSEKNHPLYNSPERHPLYETPDASPERDAQDSDEKPKGRPIRLEGTIATPYITYGLIALNVIIFAVNFLDQQLATRLVLWGVADTERILNQGEYYRLLSSMFFHANQLHIFFNMMALYYIGRNVETVFGHMRFALVYFLGGLGGALLMLLSGPGGLGASGAVFAIWGAEAVYLWQHRDLYGDTANQRLRSSLIFIGINFLFGFSANVAADAADSAIRISNAAHFGGLVGGALLAWLIGPRYAMSRDNIAVDNGIIQIRDRNPLSQSVTWLIFYSLVLVGALGALQFSTAG